MEALEIAKEIVKILDKKLAREINVLKISDLTVLADYFVIASGTNSTQVKALADAVEFEMKQKGVAARNIEGHNSNSWIILDYNSVIVHVFYKDTREFYDLDRLWSDAEPIDISDCLNIV